MKLGILYRRLMPEDFRVLAAIEKGMRRHEYVPVEVIEKYSRIHETRLKMILGKLHRLSLVRRSIYGRYMGFRLTYLGLDMLALRSLVERGFLEALGERIGVGKESEIYIAVAPGDIYVAVKFMRIGRTSFRGTRRVRSFAEDPRLKWYDQSKIAAEREFKALKEIFFAGGHVPRPIAYSRHVVVTEYIEGVELYTKPPLSDPEAVLYTILDTLRKAYLEVGIVHGDLSEYNIIVSSGEEKPYIIDWPQYVYRDHPSSELLLRRDIGYIVRFFKKNYRVSLDAETALRYVKGEQEQG